MEKAIEIKKKSLFEGVTVYHWLVVIIASCGWLFDCMDQRIFALARRPAITALMGAETSKESIGDLLGLATGVMMVGWATGGIIFGIMSDKWGRVKTMVATLLVYSGFTGLSGISQTVYDFLLFRFMVGLGVGGMFGSATTLVAESVPSNFRTIALGSLQALSACGNIIGSLITLGIKPGSTNHLFGMEGWRIVFFVGIIPALLVIPIIFVLREPEVWKAAKQKASEQPDKSKQVGSMSDLFRNPVLRRNAIVGLCLGLSGMAGLWGIGFFSPELIDTAMAPQGASQEAIDTARAVGTALQDVGSLLGMVTFTFLTSYLFGRRLTFFISFLLCFGVTIFVFQNLETAGDAYWMLPMMGFAQLSVFAGYSIYFPELFPTRLRGTGVGFCYNTVRYLAAFFPSMLYGLNRLLTSLHFQTPFRTAATIMSVVFILGAIAVIWAPETKDQPLPED